MLNKTSKIHLLTITLSSFLTACGDGDDNTQSSNFTPTTISGTAVDFYLKNADIKFNDCDNTPIKTDANGHFSFTTTAACHESALTITGGMDIGTNLPFTGTLKFKKMDLKNLKNGTLVVSPLTSLEYFLEKAGQSNRLNTILKNLALNNINNISQFDPAKDGDAHTMAVVFIFQQLATQIEDRLQTINNDNGSTAFTQEQAAQITFDALISQLSTQPLFTADSAKIDSEVLKSIINKAIDIAKAQMNDPNNTIDPTFTDQVSNNIIAVSNAIDSIAQNGGTGANLLSKLQKNPGLLQTLTETLKSPVYSDFFLANYDIAALKASSETNPLNINSKNLSDTLAVQFRLANAKSELNDTVTLAFTLNGANSAYHENLNIIFNNIQVKFNNQGSIVSAKILKNTVINVSLSSRKIQQLQFSVPEDTVISSNGKIFLNDLIPINSYINTLPIGSLVQVTVYIIPSAYTINPQLNLSQERITIGNLTLKGSALTAYFKLS